MNHNIQDINGETLLHYATYRNFSLIIELLLQFGCNTDIQIKTGLTAKDLAVEQGHSNIVDVIKNYELPIIKEVYF